MNRLRLPPDPAPVENEIINFFAQNNFERSRRFSAGAYDPANIRRFLESLGNPQYKYKTLHVAGTAGKGSVTTYLARGLSAMGYKTGAYLSPHFLSLRERFVIGESEIIPDELSQYWHFLKSRPGIHELSFFDAITALAFVYFAERNCDWAVIETGLGGRRDSTNNLRAAAAVLTRIGLDHQGILGNTIEEIAREKAGIIHESGHAFCVPQDIAATKVIADICAEKNATLTLLRDQGDDYTEKNRSYAYQILQSLFQPSAESAPVILASFAAPIFGRWTELSNKPRVIFDGGHNPPAMEEIASLVNRQPEAECNFFLNTMRERSLKEFYEILSARCLKRVNFFLFPVADSNYHSEAPFMTGISDRKIREYLQDENSLHVFTGSMGLYKYLRERFAL